MRGEGFVMSPNIGDSEIPVKIETVLVGGGRGGVATLKHGERPIIHYDW